MLCASELMTKILLQFDREIIINIRFHPILSMQIKDHTVLSAKREICCITISTIELNYQYFRKVSSKSDPQETNILDVKAGHGDRHWIGQTDKDCRCHNNLTMMINLKGWFPRHLKYDIEILWFLWFELKNYSILALPSFHARF